MRVLPLLCFMILLSPVALAGSPDDPEITGGGGTSHPDGNREIISAWIDDDLVDLGDGAFGVTFNVQTKAAFQHVASAHAVHERYRFAFVPDAGLPSGAAEAYVNLRPSLSTATGSAGAKTLSCQFGTAGVGASQALTGEATLAGAVSGAVLSCVLPLSLLPDFDPQVHGIRGLYVTHQLVQRGPLGGSGTGTGDQAGVNILRTFDRAPESGVGRDWAPLVGTGGPAVTYADVAFPVAVEHAMVNATEGAYVLNWTSPGGPAALRVVTNGTGNVSVEVLAGNTTLHNATLMDSAQHDATLDLLAGNSTIVITYTGFMGNLSLQLAPVVAAPEETEEDGEADEGEQEHEGEGTGTDTGNQTVDPDAKDTPLPLLVALTGLSLAAAVRRRHG